MKYKILFILWIVVIISACDNNKKEDNDETPILLSSYFVSLFADETTATVYTDRTDWRFVGFVDYKTQEIIQETPSSQTGLDETVFTYDWISVRKSGLDKMIIELQPNGPPYNPNDMIPFGGRRIIICISAGGDDEYISVSQTDVPDFERFSSRQLYFSATGGQEIVTAAEKDWYLYEFRDPNKNNPPQLIDRPSSGLTDDTVHTYHWISVSRPEAKEIIIKAEPNNTGKLRSINIDINCFEFHQSIIVTQGK